MLKVMQLDVHHAYTFNSKTCNTEQVYVLDAGNDNLHATATVLAASKTPHHCAATCECPKRQLNAFGRQESKLIHLRFFSTTTRICTFMPENM